MNTTTLPDQLIKSLKNVPGFDERAFKEVHESGEQITSIRMNPAKPFDVHDHIFGVQEVVPWASTGFYLPERPFFTHDPLLHAGAYYVQEASSMFVEQALKQTVDVTQTLKVLDLCAAPGGKSTLLQAAISKESLLVSNEVIKSRAGILAENITKWGAANTIVTNNDPKDFAQLENYFDVIVIDAPCSGSGLFRRDAEAINEWSEGNVMLCSQRQQRIVADVMPALKEGGILIYSTCSYSKDEDENIADWIVNEFDMQSLPLQLRPEWNITETLSDESRAYGYRFYPYNVKGEGFFICCFRKTQSDGKTFSYPKRSKLEKLSKNELTIAENWLGNTNGISLVKWKDSVLAVPFHAVQDLDLFQQMLYIKQAGILLGQITPKELIPEHSFALSSLLSNNIARISVSLDDALKYLRKTDMGQVFLQGKGWALLQYGKHNLGWVKLLSNRVNNYYPKEWRILK